ncbi:unnamed protein product [Didymodactylos carnosus]|uniref:Cysteine-rich PDZ-binding protein n=1 Tax=Didymodactylos carnosus TaxID=1234261 RepID=A0A815Z7H2_9BILA|nr:unnamed protein product [Didymodactylos carnosus]CAF4446765.1 unnamed protein product [Didymodactylos carnosus]
MAWLKHAGLNIGDNLQFNPYTTKFNKCTFCKANYSSAGSTYYQGCSYKRGICSMCGVKILRTKNYRHSSVEQKIFRFGHTVLVLL